MAYFMFVDESGQDHKESPYEVLAGMAIHDSALWSLIREIKIAEQAIFGTTYSQGNERELKAKRLLTRKTFRLSAQGRQLSPSQRAELSRAVLVDGSHPHGEQLTALGQAKVAFVVKVSEAPVPTTCQPWRLLGLGVQIHRGFAHTTTTWLAVAAGSIKEKGNASRSCQSLHQKSIKWRSKNQHHAENGEPPSLTFN